MHRCLACMLTCIIDVRMHVRTSPAAIQLDFCGVFGVLRLDYTVNISILVYSCMWGGHYPHLSSLRCPSPSNGISCVSGTLSLVFSSCRLSSSCRCACWSFGSLPYSIVAIVDSTDPYHRFPIQYGHFVNIRNFSSIPLVPSAIPTISAASCSHSHSYGSTSAGSLSSVTRGFCGSSCVSWHTWQVR